MAEVVSRDEQVNSSLHDRPVGSALSYAASRAGELDYAGGESPRDWALDATVIVLKHVGREKVIEALAARGVRDVPQGLDDEALVEFVAALDEGECPQWTKPNYEDYWRYAMALAELCGEAAPPVG